MSSEISIAVIHMKIELANKRRNLERVYRFARIAKSEGAQILILPSMFNIGPVFSDEYKVRFGRKSAIEPIPGPSSEHLHKIASEIGMHIIAGPIPERVGSKLYKTSFVVEPWRGIVAKFRQVATKKFAGGSEPALLNLGIRFGIFIEDDILLPELALYLALSQVDALLAFLSLDTMGTKQRLALSIRAIESSSIGIGIGGIVARSGEILFEVPTTVFDEYGNLVEEVKGLEERVMMVRIKKKDHVKMFKSNRYKILKELRKLYIALKKH